MRILFFTAVLLELIAIGLIIAGEFDNLISPFLIILSLVFLQASLLYSSNFKLFK
jgi:hypothetical protein